jgi:Putative prokaryotic signal transducing protein
VKELIRTNDIVLISLIRSLLEEAEIPLLVADEHMSAVEGSLGILPRRILVLEEDHAEAQEILRGIGAFGPGT